MLSYLGNDVETKVIGLYTEGVTDGSESAEVLGEVAAGKPVMLLKGGLTEMGQKAVASHTGALWRYASN
jgi:acetyltransferase